jgi:hypothetical protein
VERLYFGHVSLVLWRLPIVDGHHFLENWEIFCYYFVQYITYTSGLQFFSFFNAHDLQVWSFDGIAEFLQVPITTVESFVQGLFCFSLILVLSLSSEILSSTWSSLLEWLSTVFFI